MCKLAHVIRYTVLSQNFHFCCFRTMAYIRLWNWVQFCLFNLWYRPTFVAARSRGRSRASALRRGRVDIEHSLPTQILRAGGDKSIQFEISKTWQPSCTKFSQDRHPSSMLPSLYYMSDMFLRLEITSRQKWLMLKIGQIWDFMTQLKIGEGWAKCMSEFYELGLGPNLWYTSGRIKRGCQKNTEAKHTGWAKNRTIFNSV